MGLPLCPLALQGLLRLHLHGHCAPHACHRCGRRLRPRVPVGRHRQLEQCRLHGCHGHLRGRGAWLPGGHAAVRQGRQALVRRRGGGLMGMIGTAWAGALALHGSKLLGAGWDCTPGHLWRYTCRLATLEFPTRSSHPWAGCLYAGRWMCCLLPQQWAPSCWPASKRQVQGITCAQHGAACCMPGCQATPRCAAGGALRTSSGFAVLCCCSALGTTHRGSAHACLLRKMCDHGVVSTLACPDLSGAGRGSLAGSWPSCSLFGRGSRACTLASTSSLWRRVCRDERSEISVDGVRGRRHGKHAP